MKRYQFKVTAKIDRMAWLKVQITMAQHKCNVSEAVRILMERSRPPLEASEAFVHDHLEWPSTPPKAYGKTFPLSSPAMLNVPPPLFFQDGRFYKYEELPKAELQSTANWELVPQPTLWQQLRSWLRLRKHRKFDKIACDRELRAWGL